MTQTRAQLESAQVLSMAEDNLNAIFERMERLGFPTPTLKHAIKAYSEAYAVFKAETAFFSMSESLAASRRDARDRTKWLAEILNNQEGETE